MDSDSATSVAHGVLRVIALLVYSLVIFGIGWGFGLSGLSFPFRKRMPGVFATMFECIGCQCFHWGWIAYALNLTPPQLSTWWIAAFYSAATSLILLQVSGLNRAE